MGPGKRPEEIADQELAEALQKSISAAGAVLHLDRWLGPSSGATGSLQGQLAPGGQPELARRSCQLGPRQHQPDAAGSGARFLLHRVCVDSGREPQLQHPKGSRLHT